MANTKTGPQRLKGGLEPGWTPGDLMLLEDHVNLTGQNPLLGPNEEGLGTRFPDMTDAYDPGLREMAQAVAKEKGLHAIYSIADSGAAYVHPGLDLSVEITKRLDAKK